MLGLAKQTGAKILQASTSEVYGDPVVHPQPESYWGNVNPIGERSCYDEGKRCAETLFMDYHRKHGIRIKIVRIFNTYGPNMLAHDGRVVSNFVVQALNNKDITIYGDGMQTRSFQYIDDFIEGMVRMMDSRDDFIGPVNIGNPGEFTILELAEKVIKLTNSKSKIIFQPLPFDDPKQRKPDITLAKKELGMGSMLGSILSATVLTILPEATRSFESYRMVVYSLVLVLMMIFRPGGLLGSYDFSLSRIVEKAMNGELFRKHTKKEAADHE